MHELRDVRLRLFDTRATDVDLVSEILNDPQLRSLAFPEPPVPVSRETIVQRLASGSIAPLTGESADMEFAIEVEGFSRPVGAVGLYGMDRHHKVVEFGVIISDPEARGRSLAADCFVMLARWAFLAHGMVKVFVQLKESNREARRALERFGIPCHGVLPDHRWIDGRHEALHIYGLLRADWSDDLLDWPRTGGLLKPAPE